MTETMRWTDGHPDEEALADHAFDVPDGRPGDPDVVAHVAGCAQCSADLAELSDLARGRVPGEGSPFARAVDDRGEIAWQYPDERVWDAIAAEMGRPALTVVGEERPARAVPAPADRAGDGPTPAAERSAGGFSLRRTVPWLAGVAALVVGLALGRGIGDPSPEVTEVARLSTVDDAKDARGQAELVRAGHGLQLRVQPQSLPKGPGYLEVWLLNTDGSRMVSVGVLDGDSPQDYTVTQDLIDEGYTVVDISREAFDDKPEHSGDSLARGTLGA